MTRKHILTAMLILVIPAMLQFASCGGGGGGSSDGGSAKYNSSDVESAAINALGGDIEASTAILMAMAKDAGLENIVKAIMAGTLDENGNIASSAARLADLCQNPDDEYDCNDEIDDRISDWENQQRENLLTGIILRAGARGYTADQITAAVVASLLGTAGRESISLSGEIFECVHPVDVDPGCVDIRKIPPNAPIVSIFTDVKTSDTGSGGDDTGGGDSGDDGGGDGGGEEVITYPATYEGTFSINSRGCVNSGLIKVILYGSYESGSATATSKATSDTCYELSNPQWLTWSGAHAHINGYFTLHFGSVPITGTYNANSMSGSSSKTLTSWSMTFEASRTD